MDIKRLSTQISAIAMLFTAYSSAQVDQGQSALPTALRKYDRFKNETTFDAATPLLQVVRMPGYQRALPEEDSEQVTKMIVSHTCAGDVGGCAANNLTINFVFATRNWVFRGAGVIFLVDGKREPMSSPVYSGEVIGANSLIEVISMGVPGTVFSRMAKAAQIETEIGGTEFALSEDNLASFRAVMRTVVSASGTRSGPKPTPTKGK